MAKGVIGARCVVCGSTRRFVRSGECIKCNEKKKREDRKSPKKEIKVEVVVEKCKNNRDDFVFDTIRLSKQENIKFLKALIQEKKGYEQMK